MSQYNRRHCTPPRTSSAYDSPMLPPSPLRQRPLFPLDTNVAHHDDSPAQAHSFNPFFAPKPQPIPVDDEEGAIFLSSNSGSGSFSPFFSTSTSQPLRTPVKQVHRVASRSALAAKSANALFAFGATPAAAAAAPPPDLVSAQAARVGVGTKRKSTPHATPLRPNTLTPLKTAQSVRPDSSFERLAPLQAPKFIERTPQTKAETDAYLKRQTATLTRLRLSDHASANARDEAEFDFDGPADDSGCEMDEDEPPDSLFLGKPKKPAQHLVFQPPVTKGKEKEEVAEAVSPGGHVTKRRARSRPLSAELREQAFKVPKSPIRLSGIPCRVGGANRPRHSGPVVFPSTAHRGRASPASNSSPSDAGSPRPRRRISGGLNSTLVRPLPGHHHPPRAPLSRIESVSSATLFFGPAIPAPSPSKDLAPAAPSVRSRTSSTVHSSVPVPFSPLPVPRQLRPNLANRHSYAGPESGAGGRTMWNAFQMRDVSPTPGSSPFQEDDQRSRRRDSTDVEDEDMFFAGEGDSSFVMSVTSPKPAPVLPMPLKYKPMRNSASDEEDMHSTGSSVGGFLSVMPKASTSVSSFCSDEYEGLVTPGVTPEGSSGWPTNANVFVNGSDDVHAHGHPYNHDSGVDVDAFIMQTLAAASKGAQTTAMPKKAPGTPVKKSRPGLAYFGVERPWQSAVASKVGLKDDCEFVKEKEGKKPRKSMPAAFPVAAVGPTQMQKRERKVAVTRRNQDNNTDTEPEDAEESPSARRDVGRYTGLGLGLPPLPTALPRNRWLMRRSSSGAFSSGGESLTSTPTRTKGVDWQLPKPRIPLRLSPSGEETLGKDSPRSASGSSSSSSIITLHSPTAATRAVANANGRRAAYGSDHQQQQQHLAPRASVSTRTRRLSDAYAIGFASEEQLQSGRFAREFEEIEEVGSGEFGKVIKVQRKSQTGDDDEVGVYAIKKSKRFEGVKHRLRLREEVDILKHLSQAALTQYVDGRHPNVLSYMDSWEEDEALFIQTELCELGNLARFLWVYGRRFPRLDEARVWKIVVDLSNGLRFIHDSGVIHLDLKPSNVFMTKEGRFKIGDFGMASLWPRCPADPVANCLSSSEPRGGGGFEREGDKLYLAPEVLQGRYGKEADVFSFGMTILETASNIVVPDQLSPASVAGCAGRGPPSADSRCRGEGWQRLRREDLSQVVDLDELSPELVGLVRSMMRTDPGRRATVAEVCAHPVVSRARDEMESVGWRLRREGKSEWDASPLAGVPEGFLEMILGRELNAMDTGA